jgi:hypothetical protein
MILLLLLLLLPLNVTGATSSDAANEGCLVFTSHPAASEPDKAATLSRINTLQVQRAECQGGGRLFH